MSEQPPDERTLIGAEDEIDRRLEALSPRAQAAFYIWAARGLQPAYERFVRREAWGDVEVLARSIAVADRFVHLHEAPSSGEVTELGEALQSAAPHADDFDDPDTIGAQDAVIAADAALRLARGVSVNGLALYILEHAELAVTYRRTGSTGLGSGPEADAWDREIINEPSMRSAIEAVEAAVSALEANRPIVADGSALDPS